MANRITFIRFLTIPVYIFLLLSYTKSCNSGNPFEGFRYLAIAIYVITLSMDVLDGYLARSRNEITKLGSILDPLADKVLLVSSFILLSGSILDTSSVRLPLWFVILVLSRDFVLVFGACIINYCVGSIRITPRLPGKIATFFQALVIGLVLVQIGGTLFHIAIAAAALCTVISALYYFMDGFKQLENKHT